jgi:hypothetical protein
MRKHCWQQQHRRLEGKEKVEKKRGQSTNIGRRAVLIWGKIRVRFESDARSDTWDFNLVDEEGLSVTFKKVNLTAVDTVTLKDIKGTTTAEMEWSRPYSWLSRSHDAAT